VTAGTPDAGAHGDLAERFSAMWSALEPVGRRPDGGYDRFSWTEEDAALRAWFRAAAAERGMPVEQDRNGNLWAWWGGPPAGGAQPAGAVALGSHLDSVPRGGAFDGPLGVVSAFLAIDELRGAHGDAPARPVAVVAFSEEEGARFGVACLGSRLTTGAIGAGHARGLLDADGTSLAEAMAAAGAPADALGPDPARLASLACYVELHVEQGRALADLGAPVGIASGIWPHGRWRLSFEGQANHAGTTWLTDRRDPLLPLAAVIAAAREAAAAHGTLATIGRVSVDPNATNAIAARADAWLDVRAGDEELLGATVADVVAAAEASVGRHAVALALSQESESPAVTFDAGLRRVLFDALGGPPELATGAGHDAGILAAVLPTAMLFVRNPTGVSHSPAERADPADCVAGVLALSAAVGALFGHAAPPR
jgi:N-carbamoyl-L-amino-acid hydrolase